MTEFVWLIVVTAVALQRGAGGIRLRLFSRPDRVVISRHRHPAALHPAPP